MHNFELHEYTKFTIEKIMCFSENQGLTLMNPNDPHVDL